MYNLHLRISPLLHSDLPFAFTSSCWAGILLGSTWALLSLFVYHHAYYYYSFCLLACIMTLVGSLLDAFDDLFLTRALQG
jgi:hypothetical protein